MKQKRTKIKVNPIFIIVLFLAFGLAIVKLCYVGLSQEVDGINLTNFANNRDIAKLTLYASRGKIYDVNGNVLAQNVNSYTLIAYLSEKRTTDINNPKHVVDKEATARALSEVLGMTYEYALSRLNVAGAYQVEFGVAGANLSEHTKVQIEALNLAGIGFISGTKRYYRNNRAASYIIGYAKKNEDGEIVGDGMGIEGYYDNILKGQNGYTEYQRDAVGYSLKEIYTEEPVSGSDIYLTIDTQIQLILEDAVSTLEKEQEFDWFTISVMDAKTGAIVGSSSSPNFDLNTLAGLTSYVNPLVGYAYEPGSTMKIYNWLAVMEEGLYNKDETFKSGSVKVNGAVINDFNNGLGWGNITYDTGFVYSSNVGATYLAQKLGNEKLTDFYLKMGFGQTTGIELPGEVAGVISITNESGLATASFGQGGVMTTPIQNLQALSVLTNDGEMIKPYIVDKIVDENGNVTFQASRTSLGQKVSSTSIKNMQDLLYKVVYQNTSNGWQPSNVTLAGKTGTAQFVGSNGYMNGPHDYIRSFAGYFPYEDPQYIIYASVKRINNDTPPLQKAVVKVVESIANYANVTNNIINEAENNLINIKNYISANVDEVIEDLEKLKVKVVKIGSGNYVINQYPLKNAQVIEDSKVFILTESEDYLMPDMVGWSSNEVISFCNLIGLKYHFNGYGRVVEISQEIDSVIDLNETLEVTLSLE